MSEFSYSGLKLMAGNLNCFFTNLKKNDLDIISASKEEGTVLRVPGWDEQGFCHIWKCMIEAWQSFFFNNPLYSPLLPLKTQKSLAMGSTLIACRSSPPSMLLEEMFYEVDLDECSGMQPEQNRSSLFSFCWRMSSCVIWQESSYAASFKTLETRHLMMWDE